MKLQITSLFAAALMAGSVAAHSWLECVDSDVPNYAAAKADPNIDPSRTCKGSPRNKVNQDDWISESSNYVWDLNSDKNPGGLACRPSQTNTYTDKAPMTVAQPGSSLRMRFWGNGHSRWDIGSPNHRDPGLVRVYWTGNTDTEIRYKSDLDENHWFANTQSNFSADAVILIQGNTMNEKANYMTLNIPMDIADGVYPFVWTWAWSQGFATNPANFNPATDYNNEWANSYSTCFDIRIQGSSFTGPSPERSSAGAIAPPNTLCSTGSGLKGGMSQYPCTGAECPPCWYKTATGANCFDYDSTGKCPFGGAWDCKLNKQLRRAMKHERTPFA